MNELNARQIRRLEDIKKQLIGSCDECHGFGYDQHGEMCECMVIFQYIMQLVKANIPENYWELSLDALKVSKGYKNLIKKYILNLNNAVNKSLGIIFMGPNGIGKTSLLCEAGKRAIVSGYGGEVLYLTVQQFMNAHYDAHEGKENEFCSLDVIHSSSILLLDELDKVYIKKESDFVVRTVEDFFRQSIGRGRSIIMATNWMIEDIESIFGESFSSLLTRNLSLQEITGEDYSVERQSSWLDLLENKVNYYADDIVKMSHRLQDTLKDEGIHE